MPKLMENRREKWSGTFLSLVANGTAVGLALLGVGILNAGGSAGARLQGFATLGLAYMTLQASSVIWPRLQGAGVLYRRGWACIFAVFAVVPPVVRLPAHLEGARLEWTLAFVALVLWAVVLSFLLSPESQRTSGSCVDGP